ncbi:unnamed protein product [Toxocara canis]|uniref:Uncharacterized protein n=1 Tax=Toxocara canis TaxID=6265 RepID=A0A183VBE2_TOXCA|nr:unnamed protein product [Toxocara canis]
MELNEEGGVTEVSSDSDVLDENDCCDDYIDRPCKISSQENITWQDAGEDGTCSNWSGISSFFSNSRLSEDKNRRRSRRQEFFSLVKRRRQRGSLELRSTRGDEGVLKTAPFCMSAGSFAFRPYSSSCTTFKWCCNPCMRNGRTVDYETQYLLSAHLHALYHIFIEHVNDRERLLAETERRKIESELGFMLKFEVRSQENIRCASYSFIKFLFYRLLSVSQK